MSRALKYDIPGVDWRRSPEWVRDRVREGLRDRAGRLGWQGVFAPELPAPRRLVVDLGFGRGEFLMNLAVREPGWGFLGVEVSSKRLLKMARRLARSELRNVRLIESTAERAVGELLPEGSVSCFWINFPDPWPKKRHHRRRLIGPDFVRDLAARLEPGGVVNIATDHPDYAEVADAALAGEPGLENCYAPERFLSEVPGRPQTAYEAEWRAEGRPLRFFSYARCKSLQPSGFRKRGSSLDTPKAAS